MPVILARKLGMITMIDPADRAVGVTALKVGPNFVVSLRPLETERESATKNGKQENGGHRVQIGFGDAPARLRSKALRKHMRRFDATHKFVPSKIIEFQSDREYELDQILGANEFQIGDKIKVQGISKGKGYQGGMKRHGFHGGRASHGSSFHRALGSTGAHTDPGKNYKGRKMPGQMGNHKVSVRNLQVQAIDEPKNLIFVLGAVPGPRNGLVTIELAIPAKLGRGS